jgi:hypothetical protein
MKNWKILTFAGVLALVSVPLLAGQGGDTYGTGITVSASTPISTLLASPSTWLGKKVRVEGVITSMCEKSGCWVQITDAASHQGLRVRFQEGAVSIPLTAKGHNAAAEGIFELNPAAQAGTAEASEEANCPYHQQEAAKYQVSATGAVVYP